MGGDDDGSLAQLRVVQRHDDSTAPRQLLAALAADGTCSKDKCGVGLEMCCGRMVCVNVDAKSGVGTCGVKAEADTNATAACSKDKCGVGHELCCDKMVCNNVDPKSGVGSAARRQRRT